MKKICIFFLFITCSSCGGKIVEYEATYRCKMENASGHTVALEVDDVDGRFPARVIIEPTKSFEINYSTRGGFSPMMPRDGKVKITFDQTYAVVYTRSIRDRNPYWEQNYVITEIREDVFECIYTFTEQDYLDTVEQAGR